MERPVAESPDTPALLPAQTLFLEYYCVHGLITAAAESVGIPQYLVGRWKREPAFALALEEAEEVYRDVIRREMHRRAIDGWEVPIYQRGELVGYEKRWSDTLLMKLATAKLPEFKDESEGTRVSLLNQTQVVLTPWREKQIPEATVIDVETPNGQLGSHGEPAAAL